MYGDYARAYARALRGWGRSPNGGRKAAAKAASAARSSPDRDR